MWQTYSAHIDTGDFEGGVAFFLDYWAGKQGAWATAPERLREMMRAGGGRLWYEIQYPQPAGPDPMGALSEPVAPTLLIQGENTQEAVQAICDIVATHRPGTRRLRVPGAGHMAPFTHAEIVAPTIREHIQSAEESSAETGVG
jgi:pimeloyl-ACP methyl ester carboxylesterase